MNKIWRLVLVGVVSMALQSQSLACSGTAIGSIGSSSASPPGAPSGVRGRGLLGITDAELMTLMPQIPLMSEQTEFEKALSSEIEKESLITKFTPARFAPIVGIAVPFVEFGASLVKSINNPTHQNEKDMAIAGIEVALATTGAAIALAIVASGFVVVGPLVGISLAVASHFGAVAIVELGEPK